VSFIDDYRWIIPLWFGGLMLIVLVRWIGAERRHRKEDEQVRRFIEQIQRARNERT
jgi:hypothetical protein